MLPSEPDPASVPFTTTGFVGRERELRDLTAAFDQAAEGEGSLAMVVGEPGIGKTALCGQLESYVEANGGTTLVGHCYEEGSLSLPYLAFVEAICSYVLERNVDELKAELGTDAGDLSRIVPEIRNRLGVEPTPPSDPEQDRYRLLQAASTFLRNASDVQPLLIVLEDLHDADSGTLDMLSHVARNLSDSRLLIVGTYRDVEVDRAHPLSGAIVEMRRALAFGRVTLRGLTADEVHRMMSGMAEQEVSWGLVQAVYRQTEGNPLFVQEVLRYLEGEGLLASEDARRQATGQTPLELGIPEGLRDAIGKRLMRLSAECNRVLGVAAVIGRDFSLPVLREVADLPEDELFAALEEAQNASVIEESSSVGAGVGFRFAHTLFRQTLYEETFAPRRVRLHQQVGRALEEVYAGRPEEHAAEMAEHFAQSTERGDLEKALKYGEMAAERAMGVYAYGEAARLLERALQVQEVLDPDDKAKRCDLLLDWGDALMPAGEPKRVYDTVAPDAFALAEAMDDRGRLQRTCRTVIQAGWRYRATAIVGDPMYHQWMERADRYADPDTADRALVEVQLGETRIAEGNLTEGRALMVRALELARRLDDPETLYWVAASYLNMTPVPPRLEEEKWRLVTEMEGRATVGVTPSTLAMWLFYSGSVYLDWGERARAEAQLEEIGPLAQRTGDPISLLRPFMTTTTLAFVDGRLEEAVSAAEQLPRRAEEMGVPGLGQLSGRMFGYRPLLHLGRVEEAIATTGDALTDLLFQSLVRAHLGPSDEAEDSLRRLLTAHPGFLEDENVSTIILVLLLETAVLIEDRELCSVLAQRLGPVSLLSIGFFAGTCPARHLGAAAALLGEPDKARGYYHEALAAAAKIRFRPEIALTRLQLAELLLDPSTSSGQATPEERAEAMEHLDFAIGEFRDMKMQPSLERAVALQEKTATPATRPTYPDGLTRREVEVLRLIAAGSSNREIADELVLSVRTVERHINNIYRKIDARGRTAAVAYALTHDMNDPT